MDSESFLLHYAPGKEPLRCTVLPFPLRIGSVKPHAVRHVLPELLDGLLFARPKFLCVTRTEAEVSVVADADTFPKFSHEHEGVVALDQEYAGIRVAEGEAVISEFGVIASITRSFFALDTSALYLSTYSADVILVPRDAINEILALLLARSDAVRQTLDESMPDLAAAASLQRDGEQDGAALCLTPGSNVLHVARLPVSVKRPLAYAALRLLLFQHDDEGDEPAAAHAGGPAAGADASADVAELPPHDSDPLRGAASAGARALFASWTEDADEISALVPSPCWPWFQKELALVADVCVVENRLQQHQGALEAAPAAGSVEPALRCETGHGEEVDAAEVEPAAAAPRPAPAAARAAPAASARPTVRVHESQWAVVRVEKGAIPVSDSVLISSLATGLARARVPIYYQSTFVSDYVLVPRSEVRAAVAGLRAFLGGAVDFEGGDDAFAAHAQALL